MRIAVWQLCEDKCLSKYWVSTGSILYPALMSEYHNDHLCYWISFWSTVLQFTVYFEFKCSL